MLWCLQREWNGWSCCGLKISDACHHVTMLLQNVNQDKRSDWSCTPTVVGRAMRPAWSHRRSLPRGRPGWSLVPAEAARPHISTKPLGPQTPAARHRVVHPMCRPLCVPQ
jgi:hypothetical protein